MEIYVWTLTGKKFTIEVEPSDLIDKIKMKIQELDEGTRPPRSAAPCFCLRAV
jgi:ubiquitin